MYAVPNIAYSTGQNFLQESTDGGSTWTQVLQPGNATYISRRIATSTDGNTLIIPSAGVIYTSTDAGSTFVRRNLVLVVGASPNVQAINSIACDTTGQTIYVATTTVVDVIRKSVDGGANWSGLTASGSALWLYVKCSSNGQYIYTCRTTTTNIYVSTDSGSTFNTSSTTILSGTISSIACDVTGQYVLVTPSISNTAIYRSTDYGSSWSALTASIIDGTKTISEVVCNSTGAVILARTTQLGKLILSTDSGTSFNEITSAGDKTWSAISISGDGTRMIASTTAVIAADGSVTTPGSVWLSVDSGATWTEQTSIPVNELWSGLQISPDGSKIYASGAGMQLYKGTV